ncbi:MAG TPA: hypothetical protein VG371_03320, partial [Solirubrobacteraceae bacterium]|nr:hypothetical protein [Solirubrobacteraceae bacterium]
TIELIADRVMAALRDDLETLAADLLGAAPSEQLTVEQVARRLGVATSTVYAHWREWGGYKLGPGNKAPIRFDSTALPIVRPQLAPASPSSPAAESKPARKRRKRSDLLGDVPRLPDNPSGIA